MIKEEKDTDFYTTGRQPSEQEFARISEWIKKDKAKGLLKTRTSRQRSTSPNKSIAASGADTAQHQQL